MKFGDGGHDPGDPLVMLPVAVTDDDLYGTIHIAKSVTVTFPEARKVQFVSEVETTEGNGTGTLEYSEAGLYYNSGTQMFAHKAFGYIVKNVTIRLVATWIFVF